LTIYFAMNHFFVFVFVVAVVPYLLDFGFNEFPSAFHIGAAHARSNLQLTSKLKNALSPKTTLYRHAQRTRGLTDTIHRVTAAQLLPPPLPKIKF
jgi:hypothetical protein